MSRRTETGKGGTAEWAFYIRTLPATMPSRRPNSNLRVLPSAAVAVPAYLAAGLLFAGSSLPVNALVVDTAAMTAAFRGLRCSPSQHRRSCVRPRGAGRLRLSAAGGSGAEGMDSSELYADMRQRLEVRGRGIVLCESVGGDTHLQAACSAVIVDKKLHLVGVIHGTDWYCFLCVHVMSRDLNMSF